MQEQWIQNPDLPGDSFFWKGETEIGILIIHGFTATTAEVRIISELFHKHGYTISGPLLPGHGTTPQEMNHCTWQNWAEAVEKAFQELRQRCKYVFVSGESMGGVLALYLAAAHPDITGVLLFAPAIKVPSIRLARFIYPFKPIIWKKPSRDGLPWKGYKVYPMKAASQFVKLQRVTSRLLPKIRQPILIFQGRLDTTIDPSCGDFILSRVQSSKKKLEWLEESPHCIILAQEVSLTAKKSIQFIDDIFSNHNRPPKMINRSES